MSYFDEKKKDLMRIERVDIDKVYPDEQNPRDDFGDIDKLAASFACTPDRPGEPVCPPVLVAAGDIYHIVDGERRFRAMKKLGTKSFQAIVCENFDDADVVMSMVSTDDKKELTDLEKSRGVQRMLFLGVEPKKVEKASGFKGVNRIKTAMKVAGGRRAQCMTLDQLLAIEEFKDDTDAARRIMESDNWEYTYHQEQWRRERDAEKKEIREYVIDAGIRVVEPDGRAKDFDSIVAQRYGFDSIKKFVDSLDDKEKEKIVAEVTGGLDYYFYSNEPVDHSEDREKAKREAEIEEKVDRIEDYVSEIYKFYAACKNSSYLHVDAMDKYFRDKFVEYGYYGASSLDNHLKEWDIQPKEVGSITGYVAMKIAWMVGPKFNHVWRFFAKRFFKNEDLEIDDYDSESIRPLLELVEVAEADDCPSLDEELAVIWNAAKMALKQYDRSKKDNQDHDERREAINEVD